MKYRHCKNRLRRALAATLLLTGHPAAADLPAVDAILAQAPAGTRIGLVVTDDQRREIVAILPDQRFMPASNTKLVTTAVAFANLAEIDAPDWAGATMVSIDRGWVTLHGGGDARLSSAPDCITDCLATLADAVAKHTRRVGGVIGDATLLPDQRWSAGMSWNNIVERSGTAVAALTLDSNEVPLLVVATAAGQPPRVSVGPYYRIDNRAVTIAEGSTTLDVARLPFERTIVLTGAIAVNATSERFDLGVDDPAHYAAWSMARMLRARGVTVRRYSRSRYAPPGVPSPPVEWLARTMPLPLHDDLMLINKTSQNLHAELLLRRVGRQAGDGTPVAGLAAVDRMMTAAGVSRSAYDFADGSGMSTYNRISPRAMAGLLNWIAAQPWGQAFRTTLPIGGVDGTLKKRFAGTPLEGRIFAKTGTLNGTAALSGWITARSGRTLIFSMFANDVPDGQQVTDVMDAALCALAEGN